MSPPSDPRFSWKICFVESPSEIVSARRCVSPH
jgi:hypothetical protein